MTQLNTGRSYYFWFFDKDLVLILHDLPPHTDMNNMQLDDSIMKHIETTRSEELKESRDLISRIRRRDLYQVMKMIIR